MKMTEFWIDNCRHSMTLHWQNWFIAEISDDGKFLRYKDVEDQRFKLTSDSKVREINEPTRTI